MFIFLLNLFSVITYAIMLRKMNENKKKSLHSFIQLKFVFNNS